MTQRRHNKMNLFRDVKLFTITPLVFIVESGTLLRVESFRNHAFTWSV